MRYLAAALRRHRRPGHWRKIRPPLISMRATRDKFDELVLTEPRFDPVASIK